MINVVYLGSKAIGHDCLELLLQHPQVKIIGVLSNDNARFDASKSVIALARKKDVAILEDLNDLPEDIDILYSVQYHRILKAHHISKAKLALNLHMAPLPEYRGSNQFSLALLEEKEMFGVTIHKMDAKIDHGDILFEKRFPIPSLCWIEDLYHLSNTAALTLFRDTLSDIVNGNYTSTPQQQLVAQRGTSLHFRNEIDTLKLIDLSWPIEKIERHIRATSMPGFAPPYAIIQGRKVELNASKNG
jgi:methionyl-tRNA formyltransferase